MSSAGMVPLSYREQEHMDAPSWGLQKFPVWLQRKIKARAALTGRTITEVLVDELTAVAERLRKDPDSRAPDLPSGGEVIDFWVVKHFPEELRIRLKNLARNEVPERTPLYKFVARELAAAAETWD